jgi:hypothetical protein
MFRTAHNAANREAVRAVIRADLNLVGLAMRAERKVIDRIVDGWEFYGKQFPRTALSRNARRHAPTTPWHDVRRSG